MGEASKDSPAVRKALETEKARSLVWGNGDGQAGIASLCARLGEIVSEALQHESDKLHEEQS